MNRIFTIAVLGVLTVGVALQVITHAESVTLRQNTERTSVHPDTLPFPGDNPADLAPGGGILTTIENVNLREGIDVDDTSVSIDPVSPVHHRRDSGKSGQEAPTEIYQFQKFIENKMPQEEIELQILAQREELFQESGNSGGNAT